MTKTYGDCVYCGDEANSIDHIPAQSRRWYLEGKYEFLEVEACMDCNLMLSNKSYNTLYERKRFILQRLEERAREMKVRGTWTTDEIMKIEGHLRTQAMTDRANYEDLCN